MTAAPNSDLQTALMLLLVFNHRASLITSVFVIQFLSISACFMLRVLMYQKCRLEAGNSCYHSVQTLLSSRLLSKNLKIKIYKTIILPVVLYGCETWSLTLKKECRLRVFENRLLRLIFGPNRNENGKWRRLHNRSFIVCIVRLI